MVSIVPMQKITSGRVVEIRIVPGVRQPRIDIKRERFVTRFDELGRPTTTSNGVTEWHCMAMSDFEEFTDMAVALRKINLLQG